MDKMGKSKIVVSVRKVNRWIWECPECGETSELYFFPYDGNVILCECCDFETAEFKEE